MPPERDGRSGRDKTPASPTGGKDGKLNSTREEKEKLNRMRKKSFGGTSRRELRLDMLGENTPGPGSYAPASTFAKAASSSSFYRNKQLATTTSSFRSKSSQRGKPTLSLAPGPGAHTPNMHAIEGVPTNGAPHLQGKGKRFGSWGATAGSTPTASRTGA